MCIFSPSLSTLKEIVLFTKLVHVFHLQSSPPFLLSKQGILHAFKSLIFLSLYIYQFKNSVKVICFFRFLYDLFHIHKKYAIRELRLGFWEHFVREDHKPQKERVLVNPATKILGILWVRLVRSSRLYSFLLKHH